jgi:hypothetical protein
LQIAYFYGKIFLYQQKIKTQRFKRYIIMSEQFPEQTSNIATVADVDKARLDSLTAAFNRAEPGSEHAAKLAEVIGAGVNLVAKQAAKENEVVNPEQAPDPTTAADLGSVAIEAELSPEPIVIETPTHDDTAR